jgi:(4S)-4-hydroxy-5-phosphonooxypentane-2,3-dione isomerase
MYVILAQGTIRSDDVNNVLDALRAMVEYSNSDQEPGCLLYVVHQSVENPARIMLYEQYVDEAAFEDHKQTEMFKQHVAGTVVSGLEAPFQVDAFVQTN